MLIGYARVSTLEQTLALQQDALTKAGCERTFTDTASGSHLVRPGLEEALTYGCPGGTLVVWRLDRLGRSLRHLIDTIALLVERYAARWSIEVAVEDAKQLFGVSQAHTRKPLAVARTIPFGLACQTLTITWYATASHHPDDVTDHRARAPGTAPSATPPPPTCSPSSAASWSPPNFDPHSPNGQPPPKSTPSAWPGTPQPHNRETRVLD